MALTDFFIFDLAVVPVLVNTGAALLPALVAGLASFFTLLFRPRQLIRVCREKPLRPVAAMLVVITVVLAMIWLPPGASESGEESQPAASAATVMMTPDDWVRLARKLTAEARGDEQDFPQAREVSTVIDVPLFFRGGNARSGYRGGSSPTNLQLQWSYSEPYAMFWSTPLVRDGRVYAAWCMLDPPESIGAIVCLNATTGERVWEVDLKGADREFKGFFSSPALTADGRYLIIGQGLHFDYDSELVCIEAATGKVEWLIDCPLHIESSPAIADDIVVVGAGAVENQKTHLPKAHSDPQKDRHPGYVFATDVSTGELIWKYPVNDPESSPAVADGVAYIGSGFNGNAVVALRLFETDEELKTDGKRREIWKTSTPHPATGAVTLAGDLVLVGCGNGDYVFQAPEPAGAVLAIEKKTGEVRWTQMMSDGVLGPIAVKDQTAIVPVRNGEIVALDLAAKSAADRVRWRSVPRQGARALAGPAFTGSHVYIVTHDGYLVVLDATTGDVIETVYINADPGEMGLSIGSPMVVAGNVYVGSETGGMRCYAGVK